MVKKIFRTATNCVLVVGGTFILGKFLFLYELNRIREEKSLELASIYGYLLRYERLSDKDPTERTLQVMQGLLNYLPPRVSCLFLGDWSATRGVSNRKEYWSMQDVYDYAKHLELSIKEITERLG